MIVRAFALCSFSSISRARQGHGFESQGRHPDKVFTRNAPLEVSARSFLILDIRGVSVFSLRALIFRQSVPGRTRCKEIKCRMCFIPVANETGFKQ